MSNTDQIEYWNGEAGQKWVEHSERLDGMLEQFADGVIQRAKLQTGEQVIDIGCGAGALTLKAAAITGSAHGVDVSEPMLALAAKRASDAGLSATFTTSDASTFTSETKYDAMLSRFGVMFFADPAAAFANIRSNMKPGGRLVFACWDQPSLNQWAMAPLQAAMPFLKEAPPQPDPHAPGPFAFADADRLAGILGDAGWTQIDQEQMISDMKMPGDTPVQSAGFMMKLGPAARLLSEQGIDLEPVMESLTKSFEAHTGPDGRVRLTSAVRYVSAVA